MVANPLHSTWRRFIQKSGVAFFWAFVIGGLFGLAVFFRVDRAELRDDPRWHAVARLWLERLEWWTYDWRARELGSASSRSDEVVLVAVDEETIANAREAERADWAVRPWPRELFGQVIDQALKEGASVVLFDQSLADVSAHHCLPCTKADKTRSDDELFALLVDAHPGKVVLTWEYSTSRLREGDRALTPTLLKVGEYETADAAMPAIRQVLTRRTRAWLTKDAGQRVLWAGTASEARARELGVTLELKLPLVTRSLQPADDEFEVDRAWLTRRLSRVLVEGLAVERLTEVKSLEAPVAEMLAHGALPAPATLQPDFDLEVRAVPLLVRSVDSRGQVDVLATAPLRALMALSPTPPKLRRDGGELFIGKTSVPIDDEGYLTIAWSDDEAGRGGRGSLKRVVPAWRLLINREDDLAGRGIRHHDNELTGRVVVLTDGRADSGTRMARTPIGRVSRATVFGQAIVDLLHSAGITRVAPEVDLWLTVAFAGMGAVLAMAWSTLVRRPGWLAWVVTLALVVGLHALVARQMLVEQHRWVAMAAPLLACALTFLASLGYARTFEASFREFVLRALGGAVRNDVFQRVERDLLLMRPERKDLTVYFSDIEGFTAVAHEKDPRLVVAVLQEYLSHMTNVALDQQGHVDKYLGDGLMAFWGAPVTLAEQVPVACEAALEMLRVFEKHRADWEKRLGRSLTLRAGLDHGPMVVGEMGTFHRVNYTVMGEPVASAFRLEGLARRYGVKLLVGDGVPAAAGDRYVFRFIDLIKPHRSAAPVRVFELVGRRDAVADRLEWLKRWDDAMSAFKDRRFAEALKVLQSLEAPDLIVARYVARCERYLAAPPEAGWSGVSDD